MHTGLADRNMLATCAAPWRLGLPHGRGNTAMCCTHIALELSSLGVRPPRHTRYHFASNGCTQRAER